MTKNFYRNEYSDTEWRKVVDKALSLGCKIEYSIYGNICTIDSTELENRIMESTHKDLANCAVRMEWAEHIFRTIENAKNE